MIDDFPAHAAMGGNNPPSPTEDALREIRARLKPFVARKRQFLKAASKVTIRDRVDAGSAADLIGLARDVRNLIDAERKAVTTPIDEAVKAANARTRAFWGEVDGAIDMVKAKLDDFARAEEKRIKVQQAEQEAELERRRKTLAGGTVSAVVADEPDSFPRPSAGPQPKRRSFRGDYGRQAIVQDVDIIEIADWRQLPDWVFEADAVKEAIRKVVAPMVKQKINIPGLNVSRDVKTSTRK